MRYSRHVTLDEIGEAGQERLEDSEAVIVGVGAVGSAAAELLVRSGIDVRVLDRDFVEESNLGRQSLYGEQDVGELKAEVAEKRLGEMNPDVTVEGVVEDLTSDTVDVIGEPDIVLDCTDNMAARFLLNDYCLREDIPWIYAGAVETRGVVFPVSPEGRPCLRCLLPEEPGALETCDTEGILNTAAVMTAALQVKEALKILLGEEEYMSLTELDGWEGSIETSDVPSVDSCPACTGEYDYLDRPPQVTSLCGRDAYQIRLEEEVDLEKVAEREIEMDKRTGVIHLNPEGKRITLFPDRAVVEASDEKEARSRLARFVGV